MHFELCSYIDVVYNTSPLLVEEQTLFPRAYLLRAEESERLELFEVTPHVGY